MRGIQSLIGAISAAFVLSGAPHAGAAVNCGLNRILSVDTFPDANGSVLVPVKIGSADRLMMLDTGGQLTGLTMRVAKEFGLKVENSNIYLTGIGGRSNQRTVVPSMTLGGSESKDVEVMILPPSGGFGGDDRVVGTLVPNPLTDLEIDFAGRKVNIFSSDHCEGKAVYWPAAAIAVVPMGIDGAHVTVPVSVEGHTIRAVVDTGTTNTTMSIGIAHLLFDLDYNGPDVEKIGQIGKTKFGAIYRHRFKTLAFEGVSVSNPNIVLMPDPSTINRVTASRGFLPDLILGADILSKMHLYFAYKEKKLYITSAEPPPQGVTSPAVPQ
jgi:predicted aspartyl protease